MKLAQAFQSVNIVQILRYIFTAWAVSRFYVMCMQKIGENYNRPIKKGISREADTLLGKCMVICVKLAVLHVRAQKNENQSNRTSGLRHLEIKQKMCKRFVDKG